MKKSLLFKIALIIILAILILFKGIALFLAFVIDSDTEKNKMGRIELPNHHYFIKIHAESIALNNGTETVAEGKIVNVVWNEDYLLFDIWSDKDMHSKQLML